MDIMNQLESKVDGRRSQNLRSLSFGNSSPTSPASYAQNGLGNYAGREHVSLDVPRGRYKTTSLPVPGLGSSRGYQLLGGSYNGNHDMISTNTPQNMAGIQTGPAWLESDAEASTYLESKDEVHDFASLRHAVLEQELYSIQSLLAQEKARETTYRQRLQTPQLQGLIQEQNPPIDLCGLHISEAIHVLNYELNNRRKIVRSTGRRLQVMIISSARTPARLTAAVEQYLMEHGLLYTQVQPGLLRILL
ncbi:CTC-interacting domain 7 [Zea mays]|nr:CTC-interacting domain 7 [Zea mays]